MQLNAEGDDCQVSDPHHHPVRGGHPCGRRLDNAGAARHRKWIEKSKGKLGWMSQA
jgi:hypothetical protein